MNRPLKFRVWMTIRCEMIHSDRVFLDLITHPDIWNCVPMQFTGLLDSNKVEIYEGDIVRCWYMEDYRDDLTPEELDPTSDEYVPVESTVHTVKYMADEDYPAFELDPPVYGETNGIQYFKVAGRIEVVGNVFENPELLTNQTKP